MEKEDLIELKKKITKLSSEEKLLRDEYLKQLAKGEILGPQTGYPNIDKPQLINYREKPLRNVEQYNNIYDMLFCDRNMKQEALGFLDGKCTWTYGKLKNVTDKFIHSFSKEGIKVGDNVLCGVTNTPEFVAVFIALVSMGATVKLFDIRASENDIINYANSSNCKYAIALNGLVAPKIANVMKDTTIKKMYVMDPKNSLSQKELLTILKEKIKSGEFTLSNLKKNELINNVNIKDLTKVMKNGYAFMAKRPDTDFSRASVKVQSSGTTGKAKTIVHSEKTMVEFAKSIAYTDITIGDGKKVLDALPPWIAYGIGDAVIDALIFGCKVELCADFDNNAVYRNIGRFTTVYAAPFHYRYLREHYNELSEEKKEEIRNVDSLVAGGDKYTAKENLDDEKLFGTLVLNGYGNNEDWGCLSINPSKNNKHGSVGIPKYGEIALIYDNDKKTDLKYNEIGEVCVLSNTTFMGYENNIEATNKTFVKHDDGNTYLHTGDVGYIDEDGYIHLLGRNERVITRLGFKLSAYTIEDGINSIPQVKECIAVEVPDEEEEHVPMVFVVPQEDCQLSDSDFVTYVKEQAMKKLKSNEVPKHIIIQNSLKYTDNNKYDFRYYEQLGTELVDCQKVKIKKI